MSKVNENIRLYRKKNKLSQSDLAKLLGKTKNVISNWERGDNSPRADTLEEICRILKITPDDIYGWRD